MGTRIIAMGLAGLILGCLGTCRAGEASKTVSGIRVDTHMVYDDYVYGGNPSGAPAWPVVSSLVVSRQEGTNRFAIDYCVQDADSARVEVLGLVMKEGPFPLADHFVCPIATLVEGTAHNLGADVPTGDDLKHLVWDAGADLGKTTEGIYIRLMASDGRPPLSLHFVTLPAADGLPPLRISRYSGFGNPAMLDNLWLWLLAKGTVRRQDQQLLGTAGAYTDTVLAESGGALTETGTRFLLETIGNVRLATPDEIQRAQEATTPGTVTQWPPVRQTAGRPVKINEYNIETDGPADIYLVRE